MAGLACVFALVALIYRLRLIKNLKDVATTAYIIILIGVFFFCAYFIFNPILKTGFLLANRAIAVKEVNRNFLVSHMPGDSTDRHIMTLQDGNQELLVWEKVIEDYAAMHGLKGKDTFQITFAKGLFGVYYLHDKRLMK